MASQLCSALYDVMMYYYANFYFCYVLFNAQSLLTIERKLIQVQCCCCCFCCCCCCCSCSCSCSCCCGCCCCYCCAPRRCSTSNYRATKDLDQYLLEQDILGIGALPYLLCVCVCVCVWVECSRRKYANHVEFLRGKKKKKKKEWCNCN